MKTLFLLLLTLTLHAQTLTGKVIKVADGDTLTLLVGETKHRIRLYGIDAPEKKQAFGKEAQNFLKKLCANKIVTVKVKGTDRYKRVVGIIYCNGLEVNRELVRNGLAWAYKRYSKEYAPLELEARKNKVGLWISPNAINPSEFRKL